MSAITKTVVIFTVGLTTLGAVAASASPRHGFGGASSRRAQTVRIRSVLGTVGAVHVCVSLRL